MKKMMTLNLTEREMKALEDLAKKKGLNKTAVMKQALALYQLIDNKVELGGKIFTEDDKKEKSEIFLV